MQECRHAARRQRVHLGCCDPDPQARQGRSPPQHPPHLRPRRRVRRGCHAVDGARAHPLCADPRLLGPQSPRHPLQAQHDQPLQLSLPALLRRPRPRGEARAAEGELGALQQPLALRAPRGADFMEGARQPRPRLPLRQRLRSRQVQCAGGARPWCCGGALARGERDAARGVPPRPHPPVLPGLRQEASVPHVGGAGERARE
mmetsp:Transcript_49541/g.116804  ORF Transcript_49541/g.116804 Transcript_49541/m.116804 type:complete len:202 (+) Transcript_49541:485-1090(+)